MRPPKIVLREFDLRAIETDVGVVRESQADRVVKSEHELAVGDVVLKALKRGEWGRWFLVRANAQPSFQARRILCSRRDTRNQHQEDYNHEKMHHSHRSPPKDCPAAL